MTTKAQLQPYAQPYYDVYAGPYVERVRPYADQLNRTLVNPSIRYTQESYKVYAVPRLNQAKTYIEAEWQTKALPQVIAYQRGALAVYTSSVYPKIEKTSAALEPYYLQAKDKVTHFHQKYLRPVFDISTPYLSRAYLASKNLFLEIGVPYADRAWTSSLILVRETLWPVVSALYRDNVKPQLVMISERISKYQQRRKTNATMEETEDAGHGTYTTPLDTPDATIYQAGDVTPTTTEQSASATAKPSGGGEKVVAARPTITADLRNWQEKFAKAADKGSEDLYERVGQTIGDLIQVEVRGQGSSLFRALNETVKAEIARCRSRIFQASAINEDILSSSVKSSVVGESEAEEGIQDLIRDSAQKIRQKATAIREWRTEFGTTVEAQARDAADSTVDVLNGIRDLGLQQIGMRWAWMDGVTYKDWAKYHETKKQLDQWRDEVRQVATKHEMIDQAKRAGDELLDSAMEIASNAAKELVRLREASKSKTQSSSLSDNLESQPEPNPTPPLISMAAEEVSEVEIDASNIASSLVDEVEEQVSEATIGTNPISEAVQAASNTVISLPSTLTGPRENHVESTAIRNPQSESLALSESPSVP